MRISDSDPNAGATDGLNCQLTGITTRITRIASCAFRSAARDTRMDRCACARRIARRREQFGQFVLLFGSVGSPAVGGRLRTAATRQAIPKLRAQLFLPQRPRRTQRSQLREVCGKALRLKSLCVLCDLCGEKERASA
jgi:hypothetical protein